jgi:hypothetical protein
MAAGSAANRDKAGYSARAVGMGEILTSPHQFGCDALVGVDSEPGE